MHEAIKPYISVGQAIAALLYPYAEVVLHDLKKQQIVALFNNISKRQIGDDSLLEAEAHTKEFPDYFEPYDKVNWDGRKLKSTTVTIRNAKGQPVGLLCINLDISKFEELRQVLTAFTQIPSSQPLPSQLFKEDWREKINQFVQEYLKSTGKQLKSLTKEDKRHLVLKLHDEGAFRAKNAASYVADALDISRATVYNYLG